MHPHRALVEVITIIIKLINIVKGIIEFKVLTVVVSRILLLAYMDLAATASVTMIRACQAFLLYRDSAFLRSHFSRIVGRLLQCRIPFINVTKNLRFRHMAPRRSRICRMNLQVTVVMRLHMLLRLFKDHLDSLIQEMRTAVLKKIVIILEVEGVNLRHSKERLSTGFLRSPKRLSLMAGIIPMVVDGMVNTDTEDGKREVKTWKILAFLVSTCIVS